MNNEESMSKRPNRYYYSAKDKLSIVRKSQQSGNIRATARLYEVQPKQIRTEISTWVSDAWEKISETTVRKSFRSSGYEIEENAGICDASSAEEGIDALSTSFYEALTLQPDW